MDKVKNLDSNKALQTLILTILDKKLDYNSKNLCQQLVDYFQAILDKNYFIPININRLFCTKKVDTCCGLCDTECTFRFVVYYEIVSKVLGELKNEMENKELNRFTFYYLHHYCDDSCHLDSLYDDVYSKIENVILLYRKKYCDKLANHNCLDILFDGVNDPE